jgi:hypothetical protein
LSKDAERLAGRATHDEVNPTDAVTSRLAQFRKSDFLDGLLDDWEGRPVVPDRPDRALIDFITDRTMKSDLLDAEVKPHRAAEQRKKMTIRPCFSFRACIDHARILWRELQIPSAHGMGKGRSDSAVLREVSFVEDGAGASLASGCFAPVLWAQGMSGRGW